jgi:hypothetical protein
MASNKCSRPPFLLRSAEGRREDAEAQKIREQITAIVDKAKAEQGF